MSLSLITAVCWVKSGKLAIGTKSGNLLVNNSRDLKYFKNVTMNNVIVMGRRTFESIGKLSDRINIVLTRNEKIHNLNPHETLTSNCIYYTSLESFISYELHTKYHVFICGGGEIYNYYLNPKNQVLPDTLHITEILPSHKRKLASVFIDEIPGEYYSLTSASNIEQDCRILIYKLKQRHSQELQNYNLLMKTILEKGNDRPDRTGTGTLSIFGTRMEFDISNGKIPLMTSRKVPFNTILEELLWFCRGETSAKSLQAKGITIWDGNSSREFLDKRGLHHYPEGTLGPVYGFQWRHFGAPYKPENADKKFIGGIDQLSQVESLLETDPYSRRIIIIASNPAVESEMALPPCHYSVQWYVSGNTLDCSFTMRSSDALAWSYNCSSYAILTHILALRHGFSAGRLIYNAGDTHIYKNHIEAVSEQLKGNIRPEPIIRMSDSIKTKDWSEMSSKDFELVGYFPCKALVLPMAI